MPPLEGGFDKVNTDVVDTEKAVDTEEVLKDNNIDDVFCDKKESFRMYLCRVFSRLRKELRNKNDKKLIFDKDFIKFLSKDSVSIKSLLENSEKDKRFVGEFIEESMKFIKKKLSEYKKIREKKEKEMAKIKEIFGDIINNNRGRSNLYLLSDLYLLLYNVKECHKNSIHEDVIFSKDFLKYIHDKSEILQSLTEKHEYYKSIKRRIISKGDFRTDSDLNDLIANEYRNFQKDWPVLSGNNIHEEMEKNEEDRNEAANQELHNVNDEINMDQGTVNKINQALNSPGLFASGGVEAAKIALENTNTQANTVGNGTQDNSNQSEKKGKFSTETTKTVLKKIGGEISSHNDYVNIKNLLEIKGGIGIDEEYIVAYCMSRNIEKYEIPNEKIKEDILNYSKKVEDYLKDNFKCDIIFREKESNNLPSDEINEIILKVNLNIKKASDIGVNFSNFDDFKNQILSLVGETENIRNLLENSDSGIDYITQKMDNYLKSETVDSDNLGKKGVAMLYAAIIKPPIDVQSFDDIDTFIRSVQGETTKYSVIFNNFINKRNERDYERKYNYAVTSLINRYERAQALAENRRFYSTDFINFSKSDDNPQNQSGLQIASKINNIDEKLHHYKLKSNLDNHGGTALKYTAFETTFNNVFNLNDPITQKLASLNIDLHSELTNYGIYNRDSNIFNKDARNKFVSDKLGNIGLSSDELENLGKIMEELPSEVEKNYEILCGNFDADQNSFEKITKIYALGEIIDKIKTLFSGLNNKKLGDFMGIQLDENKPADVIGDCLFMKGKINGTETNIKYNLRTGKLYMNSFTRQSFNPSKIVVGNTEPNSEIGNLGSFEESISNLDSPFEIQNDKANNTEDSSNLGNTSENGDNPKQDKQDTEKLIKNKLSDDLKNIGRIVKDKAGEQGKENNIINDLLKTFDILSDYGKPKDIEFMGGSTLFTLIESIKNTDNEEELLEFSNQMKELMSLCELSRGKNNEDPRKSEFSSITIFDIDEDNATTDIISLQRANKKFFSKESGEKDKIKSSQSHLDSSIQLSFANIIVQKCCKKTGSGRKISVAEMKSFVKSIKDGIADIKNDKDEVLAYEDMFKNSNMLG